MEVGSVLPVIDGFADQRGRPLNWRDMRRNRVVFFAHGDGCAACQRYSSQLLALQDRLAEWDADVWLIGQSVARLAPEAARYDSGGIVRDSAGRVRERCGIPEQAAAVVIADRWGQVWETAEATDDHALPDSKALCNTARFVDLQCSECEALDQPVCDWSVIRDAE